MVPIRHGVGNSIHNVFTTRIVPKYTNRQSTGHIAAGAASDSGTSSPAATTDAGSSTPTAVTTGTASGSTDTTSDPAADFKALFGWAARVSANTPPTPTTPTSPPNPTVESVFGPNPYITNAGGAGPYGITYNYNPVYFATKATAQKLAQMYGGTVIEMNAITPDGPFHQNQPNEMIQFANGNIVNAGALASYYGLGWSQEKIDRAILNEINGTPTPC